MDILKKKIFFISFFQIFFLLLLGHLLTWLIIPSLLGIGVFLNQYKEKTSDSKLAVAFSFFLIVWGTFFLEYWKRKASYFFLFFFFFPGFCYDPLLSFCVCVCFIFQNADFALRWGVDDFERKAEIRDKWLEMYNQTYHKGSNEVTADDVIPTLAAKLDRGTFPKLKRLFSVTFILFFSTLVVGAVIGVLVVRVVFQVRVGKTWGGFYAGLLNGICIQGFGVIYKSIAEKLTKWENWKTDIDHENAFVAKTFAFEVTFFYIVVTAR